MKTILRQRLTSVMKKSAKVLYIFTHVLKSSTTLPLSVLMIIMQDFIWIKSPKFDLGTNHMISKYEKCKAYRNLEFFNLIQGVLMVILALGKSQQCQI